MTVQRTFLVISADRSVRVAKRPQIQIDEVAIQLNLKFPDGWGRVVSTIDIEIPDFEPVVEFHEVPT